MDEALALLAPAGGLHDRVAQRGCGEAHALQAAVRPYLRITERAIAHQPISHHTLVLCVEEKQTALLCAGNHQRVQRVAGGVREGRTVPHLCYCLGIILLRFSHGFLQCALH